MREGNGTSRILDAILWPAALALGLIVSAAGCQQKYWYQEGKTFAECEADHKDCQAELLRRIDQRFPTSYRQRFMDHCMRGRGYEPVAEKKLPLAVKRQDPPVPSNVPWIHAYGVAGTIPPRGPSAPRNGGDAVSAALLPRPQDQGTNPTAW